ncbi:MAG: hypothetical protein QM811_13845 [Pirellulales bacterium]
MKGEKFTVNGAEFKAIYFGDAKPGSRFLIYGASTPSPEWSTPIEMSPALEKYLDAVTTFPKDRGERAVKIQPFLLSDDKVVHQDAYNEFATTDYADLRKVADRLDAKQIRKTVGNLETDDSEMALAYTLLGIIGTKDDVPLLEGRLRSPDDLQRKRLDALIGCYLTLKGPTGLPLIQTEFVEKDLADQNFSRLYRVLLCSRFHGDDGRVISKTHILPILHKFLDHPKYADLVIPDLARWGDWSVKQKVMELYRDKTGEASFVREPAAKYMRVCPEGDATAMLEEMQKIDPEAFKRAMLFPVAPEKPATEKKVDKKADDAPKARRNSRFRSPTRSDGGPR